MAHLQHLWPSVRSSVILKAKSVDCEGRKGILIFGTFWIETSVQEIECVFMCVYLRFRGFRFGFFLNVEILALSFSSNALSCLIFKWRQSKIFLKQRIVFALWYLFGLFLLFGSNLLLLLPIYLFFFLFLCILLSLPFCRFVCTTNKQTEKTKKEQK